MVWLTFSVSGRGRAPRMSPRRRITHRVDADFAVTPASVPRWVRFGRVGDEAKDGVALAKQAEQSGERVLRERNATDEGELPARLGSGRRGWIPERRLLQRDPSRSRLMIPSSVGCGGHRRFTVNRVNSTPHSFGSGVLAGTSRVGSSSSMPPTPISVIVVAISSRRMLITCSAPSGPAAHMP